MENPVLTETGLFPAGSLKLPQREPWGKGSRAPSPCSGMHRQVHSASCCEFLGGLMHLCVSLQLDLFLSCTDLTSVILQPLSKTFLHIQPSFLRSQWVQNTAVLMTFLFCLVIGFLCCIAL